MASKATSDRISSIAGKYMNMDTFDHIPTDEEWAEMRSCFASCVSQDETPALVLTGVSATDGTADGSNTAKVEISAGKRPIHEWDESEAEEA
jgi:hypothetical protein